MRPIRLWGPGALAALTLLTAGCNMPQGTDAPATLNVTQAYQTVSARLTEAAAQVTPAPTAATASPTPLVTNTAYPTEAVPPSQTAPPPPTATVLCDRAAAGNPLDVTIPDDAPLAPGAAFTKIWRVSNTGTCAWTREYTVEFFSGEPMGAPASIPMPVVVAPGQTIDLAVDMVAPQKTGTYQGNWKLRNPAKAWFGIGPGGNAPIWVRIVVTGTLTTGTASPTASLTPQLTAASPTLTVPATVTPTPPPTVRAGGMVSLKPADRLDLDTSMVNGGGEDLAYEQSANGDGLLTPLTGMTLASYGLTQPEVDACRSAAKAGASLPISEIEPGTYFCFQTNSGYLGWLKVLGVDLTTGWLVVQFTTWNAS